MSTASATLQITQPGMVALVWAGVGIAGLFVGARCVIRARISNRWSDIGADDYWILIAFLVLVVNGVLQTLQAPHLYYMVAAAHGEEPAGKALVYHSIQHVRYEFAIIGLFYTVLWSVKASFLAIYWRLFEGLRVWKRCWWAVSIFALLAFIGCWISSITTCHPPSAYFKYGQCRKPIDQQAAVISLAYSTTVDVLTDVLIILLPVTLIWNIRITQGAKAGLVAVFSLGLVIIVVAIIRAVEVSGKTYTDPVWLATWGIVETSVSVVVGCLPPFKSLFKFERARTSGVASSAHRRGTPGRRSEFRNLDDHSESMSYTLTNNISYSKSEPAPAPSIPRIAYENQKFKAGTVLLTSDHVSH